MHMRTLAAALVLAAAAAVPMAGVASAQDRDCRDFDTQQEAQAYFDEQGYSATNDPERLDSLNGAGDGIACEALPDGGGSSSSSDDDKGDGDQVRTKPKGSVDTGDGSTAPDPTAVFALAGMAAAGVTAAATRRATRTTR
jgi:hypothetical protein